MSITCAQCLVDPDPRGPSACAACRRSDEITALRAELASYRALPLIPKPDHDRVVQQRDEYARKVDELAAEILAGRDDTIRSRYHHLCSLVAAELRHGDTEWHTPERRAVRDEMRAELMEAGRAG